MRGNVLACRATPMFARQDNMEAQQRGPGEAWRRRPRAWRGGAWHNFLAELLTCINRCLCCHIVAGARCTRRREVQWCDNKVMATTTVQLLGLLACVSWPTG